MKIPPISIYRLAQIFTKYDYFSDERSPTEAYEVLAEVYETLSAESKDKLLTFYKAFKRKEK